MIQRRKFSSFRFWSSVVMINCGRASCILFQLWMSIILPKVKKKNYQQVVDRDIWRRSTLTDNSWHALPVGHCHMKKNKEKAEWKKTAMRCIATYFISNELSCRPAPSGISASNKRTNSTVVHLVRERKKKSNVRKAPFSNAHTLCLSEDENWEQCS